MAKTRFGKAIGPRQARMLVTDVGGAADTELASERERILGHSLQQELYRLNDNRIVEIFDGSARLYASAAEYRQLLAVVGRPPSASRSTHSGHGFARGAVSLRRRCHWPRSWRASSTSRRGCLMAASTAWSISTRRRSGSAGITWSRIPRSWRRSSPTWAR